MAKPGQTRRSFLGAVISLAAGAFLIGKFLTPKTRQKKALLTVPKGDLPPDGALVYREARVALLRQGEEVYALNLVCTHLGCTVNVTPAGLVCPCHGSSFDREGKVLKGPADRPLERYRVRTEGDFYQVLV
ncbi:MAG TPA: cytochrome B6 [Geobacter sp.]|nr:cytochrome B6 [Geobacter sp.]